MAIKFHHFFKDDCSPYVNIHDFESNFRKEFRFVKDAVVYMIHQPFLNNVIDTNIDLLLIVAVENKEKNYYPIEDKFYKEANGRDRQIYLNNIVMPIKFIDEFKYNYVKIYDIKEERNYGVCVDDKIETDFATEISTLRYGTENFFKNVLDNVEIKCLPVIWILSDVREKYYFSTHNIVQAYQFGFYEWKAFLKFSYNNFFKANSKWAEANKVESYKLLFEQMEKIKQILEDESKISKLTKNKIDRIALQHHKDNQIYEKYLVQQNSPSVDNEIFTLGGATEKVIKLPNRIQADKSLQNNLVIIQGKAGSGKTTELLLLMKKQLEAGKQVRYITYNKLLSQSIYKFKQLAKFSGGTNLSTRTIHGFMYDVGMKMGGVVLIMGNKRIENLKNTLEKHITFIHDKILSEFKPSEWGSLRSDVDNHKLFEIYAKYQIKYRNEIAEFREFQRFIDGRNVKDNVLEQYKNNQIDRICSLAGKDVFLSDYYGVLHNIYLCLTDARKFYDDYKVGDLDEEVLDRIIGNRAKYNLRNFDEFQIMINRSRGAYSRHVPMIDEGQDFHPLERDILFEIFHKKNMVVATGGKEQLIRHQLECNWTVDNQGKKHNTIIINKRNKSYRLKKGIADLCNKLAKTFEIKLDLETDNQESGHVIISSNLQDIQTAFDIFRKNGELNDLNPCESIYLIIEAESEIFKHHYDESEVTSITENGVAIQNKVKFKSEPDLSSCLDTKGLDFYYANMGNNYFNKKSISNSEYLVSFYESCRGLESWSVMCFELDKFYERKKSEEDALNFLSDDLLLSDDERRKRYAMTWVLMALTRAMDGLFIHISDMNSELGKIVFNN